MALTETVVPMSGLACIKFRQSNKKRHNIYQMMLKTEMGSVKHGGKFLVLFRFDDSV